jgi:hypothetical protein
MEIKPMDRPPKAVSSILLFLLMMALVFAISGLAPTLEQVMGW